ncbi:hypothetical protein CFIO01_06249 [Colletotrichum fioriniae PJ7]|uniref:Uncharacterized protein n=1 Tax=Colletotrichum fioriniae PJ7 TaxID=1445577 RepID=A0A010QSF0_9PEZI|nr:hypothetical protein CFIO01_06249 [Colletotrichum fioriniae PJ7]
MDDEIDIEEFHVAIGMKNAGGGSCQMGIDDRRTRKDTDSKLERKRQARIKKNLIAIRKAEDLSSRIKDIRDELNILKAVAQYQRDVQREMQKLRGSQEAGLSASHVVNDIKEMDKVTDRIQTSAGNLVSVSIAFFIPLAGYAIYSDQVVQSLSELFRTALGNKSGSQDSKSGIAKSSLPSSERIVK